MGLTMPNRSYNNGNTDSRFKFTGKELDQELDINLYYFGARYYDPQLCSWHVVDPLADKNVPVSPFQYCRNNSINRFDSDGNIDWPLKGNQAVNKKDYNNGAWGLKNTVVRTSTYLDTDRLPGASNPHIGIDYRAKVGTKFYSLGDGTVVKIGKTSKGAKYITIKYRNGDKIRFLYINSVAKGLKVGCKVWEGQVLGKTGKTGTKYAHLHFDGTDKGGNRIDPEVDSYGNVSNKEFFGTYEGDALKLHADNMRKEMFNTIGANFNAATNWAKQKIWGAIQSVVDKIAEITKSNSNNKKK